ncbi:TlpA family protein disulfide reductase [Thermoflexibacter ruber]|uniref:Thiol-disulfide isomerase or thioredoxin n=1 Tax=Thermoflexibacter ruber TaxID=1003 RepID=A0A1I2IS65_9BACT|nr:TlpA disulfide reductase family protein [Thermoflexibacter ruber]SFF44570.1 Thiol-disulfide isomerase or thioredoxin [Thermoflexibacter ruber]
MKKNILLCFSYLLVVSGLFAQSPVSISGKIINAKQDEITLQFYPPLSNSAVIHKSKIDKQGNFSLNFSIPASCLIAYLGDWQLFISPNDNFSITYDATKKDETLKFTGGKGAGENAFFVEMNKTLSSRLLYRRMYNTTPEAFLLFADSLANAQLKKYEEASKNTKFSEDFDFHFKNYVLYGAANAKLYAGSYMRYFQPNKPIEIPANYYVFLAETKLQADSLMGNPNYQEFVASYISNRYDFLKKEAQSKTNENYLKEQYQLANMLLKGKVGDFVRAKFIKDGLQYANWQIAEQLYHEEKTNFPQNEFLAPLTEVYEELKKLAPGQPAPLFTFKDIEGKEVSLSDFRGKVVYLDIWASWCGPCIAEIPHAKKLKERMKGKDVVFLYVTIDENEKSWKDMVKNKEMEGVHLISEGGWASEINKLYGVNGVPTYFLIGKDGKIFNNRPPRPSSPNIDKELEKALASQ